MNGRLLRWLVSLAHRPARDDAPRLTIVRHHRVFGPEDAPLYRLGVALDVFERQVELLVRLGLRPVTVSEALDRLRAGESRHLAALSFDDGYADNVERVLPLLERHGARGSFFLVSGLMSQRTAPWWDVVAHALESSPAGTVSWRFGGDAHVLETADHSARRRSLYRILPVFRRPLPERDAALESLRAALHVTSDAPCDLATWEQAERLVNAGMEVGAHTLHHPHLSLLDRDAQREEVRGSIGEIRERLGVRCRGLAYPEGDYDAVTIDVCRDSGLDWAVTTRGGDNACDAPVFELRRRGLTEGACLAPGRRFSERMTTAELHGAFDDLRRLEVAS